MAEDRLEECLQIMDRGKNTGAIERGGRVRLLEEKISEKIQRRPPERVILTMPGY